MSPWLTSILATVLEAVAKFIQNYLYQQQVDADKKSIGVLEYENLALLQEKARAESALHTQEILRIASDDELIKRVSDTNARILEALNQPNP